MVKLTPGVQRVPFQPAEASAWRKYKHALFLSCCESNAVPLLLQKKYWRCNHLVQTPGNIVPPAGTPGAVEAEVERALQAGVRDFVVCGHHPCDIVRTLVDAEPTGPALGAWLDQAAGTRRVLAEHYGHLEGPERLEAATQVHVLAQLQTLHTFPAIATGLADGSVALHGWVANGDLGQLFRYHPLHAQFEPWLRSALMATARGA
jgi:carbonic anhydrase